MLPPTVSFHCPGVGLPPVGARSPCCQAGAPGSLSLDNNSQELRGDPSVKGARDELSVTHKAWPGPRGEVVTLATAVDSPELSGKDGRAGWGRGGQVATDRIAPGGREAYSLSVPCGACCACTSACVCPWVQVRAGRYWCTLERVHSQAEGCCRARKQQKRNLSRN